VSRASARLEVVAGNAAGTTILVDEELLIGRDVEGPGRLADDDEISRAHARVTLDERGSCEIEDLGSTNGTFVNGVRISGPQTLAEGDSVELGGTTIVVSELSRPIVEEATKPTVLDRPLVPGLDRAAEPAEPVAAAPSPAEEGAPEAAAAFSPAQEGAPEALARPPAADLAMEPGREEVSAEAAAPAEAAVASQPSVAAEPSAAPVAGESAASRLSLRLEVDFAGTEARIWFDESSEPLRLVFEGGSWRPATERRSA
jgi:pSer/pThr/pTyr-binding forkhead associated (FHA) protein